jgi:hypothetical protein
MKGLEQRAAGRPFEEQEGLIFSLCFAAAAVWDRRTVWRDPEGG